MPKADYGRASFDVRHSAVINATYDLPFGRGRLANEHAWVQQLIANWQLSAIETAQTGLPFTPQLSYNPSNDGDTRNPVRPSWNPNFTGPVILGGPNLYFNPNAFIQPLPGTYGNVGRNVLGGPGLVETDLSAGKKLFAFGADESAVPLRILQHPESHKLQRAESRRLRVRHGRTFADGRSDHIHVNDLSPDSIWFEVTLVKVASLFRSGAAMMPGLQCGRSHANLRLTTECSAVCRVDRPIQRN